MRERQRGKRESERNGQGQRDMKRLKEQQERNVEMKKNTLIPSWL